MFNFLERCTIRASKFACVYRAASTASSAGKTKKTPKTDKQDSSPPKQSLQPQPPWKTVQDVVSILKKSVVYECDDFVVLDKPARLSCFGYTPERSPSTGDSQLDLSLSLSIHDCFPLLHTEFSCKEEMRITLPLEPQYSGLIVLSKTKAHQKLALYYYPKRAAFRDPRKSVHQYFMCLCWGSLINPSQPPKTLFYALMDLDTGQPFTKASVSHLNEKPHTFISYKVDVQPAHAKRQSGHVLGKRVAHRTLDTATEQHAPLYHLVEVASNTTYCNVMELYLLHQGVRVVGEHLHGSRLSLIRNETAQGATFCSILLPPERATLYSELPGNLREKLRIPQEWMRHMPVMAHRFHIDVPVLTKNTNVDKLDSAWKIKSMAVTSPSLPQHFLYAMDRMNLKYEKDKETK